MGREGRLAVGFVVLLGACVGKSPEPPPQLPPSSTAPRAPEPPNEEVVRLQADLDETRSSLGSTREELARVERTLGERAEELVALEESNASLELELASALEELLRAQASLRNVQSRAFAVSRIAEVGVQLKAAQRLDDPALTARIERAAEFLARADQTLGENNIGGAAYLADRAGELMRQARTVAEIRRKEPREVMPIVPPRPMEVQAQANLRSAASSESPRVAGVEIGALVEAVARQGEWFQVVTATGTKAWIHRALVR